MGADVGVGFGCFGGRGVGAGNGAGEGGGGWGDGIGRGVGFGVRIGAGVGEWIVLKAIAFSSAGGGGGGVVIDVGASSWCAFCALLGDLVASWLNRGR